ncbi:hypothetical protein PFAG_01414 [Plasmodium falciparum Santa Lucia]|uniref:Uncharacterized protein n=7 Tax=Plasmodium falciparum TaxID=5833 RepID=W7JX70_PLAFO|nr:hypothetical protein PFFVO_01447 [Plasmodium falciparum Vietnam Oak-Knoll (FVO)]ETW50459.1 hypothetical protein PFMALIP_01475 [Plasmodium falciparum MaliPS096_E11]ETW53152.1 hypothetical protein PFUGPA_04780 [Plasmodium falciparum Palo Alto/Uganda]ETW62622.1 hypothetical protein PFMC_01466 [Plasmodium falciparum CAMP/Malaysia]EUR75012.1 hypothetical protein PFBG_01452 [Plasmodium falciparum 7G8]EUT89264.1 hypothetical protein PFAG_01414 [Plasmodium falciparum Santa Lucia]EWC89623.1 hypothe
MQNKEINEKKEENDKDRKTIESGRKVCINSKKRNYEELKENTSIKSVLAFVPRVVQLNEKKNK